MRVFIVALGTRGDFGLFCALGRELGRRGHQVTLGSSAFYAEQARADGLSWVQIGSGTREKMLAALRALGGVRDPAQRTRQFAAAWLRDELDTGKAQLTATAQGCDYFISNLKLAMARGGRTIPGAFVTYDPPEAVADLAVYGSARHAGRILELVAMSQPLIDPDGTWGAQYRFTGFWNALAGRPASPTVALEAFVVEGDAPVVLTMGSMAMLDAPHVVDSFAQALRRTARRGVVVSGWARPGPCADERLLVLEEAAYDWLFARAACVIHHGGAGTLGAVLRAGAPSVLLPQLAAQAAFGRALLRERLATGMFGCGEIEPAALAGAIERAIGDAEVAAAARHWQALVCAEDGLAAAADLIEAHACAVDAGRGLA
jgi:UDP:flavonoid glycosyltransferase YjiC (YdhE family)